MSELLRVSNLKKVFRSGKQDLVLFDDLSFSIAQGELVAIVGESGSGKSTLLHILGALDQPTAGTVEFEGVTVNKLSSEAASEFRGKRIGYVWQFHYLLPEFSAEENVAMPLLAQNAAQSDAFNRAKQWLGKVGLSERGHHRPGELSGGEQQRVALARALITQPKLLMADEPTGDLDQRTGEMIFDMIATLHREQGLTSILVTHNLDFARRCQRVLKLVGGKLQQSAPEDLRA